MKVTRPGTGAQVGDYRILRSLGSGGMGQVFAARRAGGQEIIALKQVAVTDATALYRFKQEFRSLADLSHPNLVRLGELVVLPGGLAFFTMELVDGEPLARWVRHAAPAGTVPNLHRLCHALRQLAAGVGHLHRAARVHRDLKPSNVLVTAEGRVVILDFGLVYELSEDHGRITATGQAVGTPAYMAPEQSRRGLVDPAIDLYALGVILFECLTGCMPFVGSSTGMLVDKQHEPAPDPRELAEGIPDWLAQLCRALLDLDPKLRPAAEDVVALLDAKVEAAPPSSVNDDTRGPRLVGRAAELDALRQAHAEVARAGATVVRVRGPLGRGKSALVDAFLRGLDEPEAAVLRGRCHPRESVPYKGLDSLVDALALHLRALAPVDSAALQPRHVRELCELFPVLRGVWRESRRLALEREPVARRRLGVAALREVLARIADGQPLVLVIDDAHWGDLDGLDVLDELLSPPAAPAVLLVLAYDDTSPSTAILARLDQVACSSAGRSVDLALAPLTDSDAAALARSLIDPRSVDDLELAVAQLVEGSAGEPLALVRGATSARSTTLSVAADGEVLRRVRGLVDDARALLELATIAGAPLPNELVRELLACDLASFEVAACDLVMAGLLGAVALESRGFVKLAAPRVGELVRVELDAERRRQLHVGLARALATRESDPERIAEHFERGGDPEQARAHLSEAARRAADALAFARAERLYRRALALLPSVSADHRTERRALQLALADQLAHLACDTNPETNPALPASRAHGDSGPDRASKLRLEAAEQYGSAASQSTLPKLRARLREHDEHLPSTTLGALARGLFNRAQLRWQLGWGKRIELRPPDPRSPAPLERFDLVHTANLASSRSAPHLSLALRPRVLSLALATGDPLRLVVALRHEVGLSLLANDLEAASARAEEALAIAARCGDEPLVRAHAEAANHALAVARCDLVQADASLRATHRQLEGGPGEAELAAPLLARHAELLHRVGDERRLRRLLPGWIQRLRNQGARLDEARALIVSAEAALDRGELEGGARSLSLAHELGQGLGALELELALERAQLGRGLVLALTGDRPSDALAALSSQALAAEQRLRERGAWLRAPLARLCALRMLIQLSYASAARSPSAAPTARELARLRRARRPDLRLTAQCLIAARAMALGDGARATRTLREAHAEAQRGGFVGHAAAIAWRLSELGADDARTLEAQAEAYFSTHEFGWVETFVALRIPALDPGRSPQLSS